jgi:hypothetical protein
MITIAADGETVLSIAWFARPLLQQLWLILCNTLFQFPNQTLRKFFRFIKLPTIFIERWINEKPLMNTVSGYYQMAEQHQQELEAMRKDINVLGWFCRSK